jgi:hypothetical protein
VAYPGKSVVTQGISLCDTLLSQKKDNTALITKTLQMREDFLDFSEDIADVNAFFKTQRSIFDSALKLTDKLSAENEYLQAEEMAVKTLNQIRAILRNPKPYKSISELPALMQEVQAKYDGLLELKKQEVLADIQAAMAEIHQTATLNQRDIVEKADNALVAKREAAKKADSMTALDAMKIQISSIRQQYLKALVVVDTPPHIKTATISRGSVCHTAKLENEADVDQYLAEIKKKLMAQLEGNDVLHII